MQAFTVVPIINGGHFRWGVKAPRKPYESHPALVGKFTQKQHAEQFAERCNVTPIAWDDAAQKWTA